MMVPDEKLPNVSPASADIKVVDRRWWTQKEDAEAGGGTEWQPRKPTYVEELERQLAEKDKALKGYIAKHEEAAAEFDSARVRLRRDIAKEVERGTRAVLAELLDVLDNLDRAIEAAGHSADQGILRQGVEMVRDQFLAKLEGFKIRRLDVLGRRFDPARSEAALTVPVADPSKDEHVVGIIRNGYEIDGEILRPAIVAVAKLTGEGQEGGQGKGGEEDK
jgi:molecular chaperone GrpE